MYYLLTKQPTYQKREPELMRVEVMTEVRYITLRNKPPAMPFFFERHPGNPTYFSLLKPTFVGENAQPLIFIQIYFPCFLVFFVLTEDFPLDWGNNVLLIEGFMFLGSKLQYPCWNKEHT